MAGMEKGDRMNNELQLRILFLFIGVSHGWIAYRAFYALPNQQYAWILMAACSLMGFIGFIIGFFGSEETIQGGVPKKI